jgi:hypothetical protein
MTSNKTFFAAWMAAEAAASSAIQLRRDYIDINDDYIPDGIMFSFVMQAFKDRDYLENMVKRDGHLWLAMPYARWWDACRANERQARISLARIKNRGLLIVKLYQFDGSPKLHIRPDYEKIGLAIQALQSDAR